MRKSIEELMEGRQLRRMKEEDRFLKKLEKRMANAEAMIGELCREGRTVHYVFPHGGKYREGSELELRLFLMRNNYA
jgi:hypothetical protein